jgi:acetate kinase
MNVLVINSGSSSVKYQLVEPDNGHRLVSGLVERIGEDGSQVTHTTGERTAQRDLAIADHEAALGAMVAMFDECGPALTAAHIVGVGHRVVHGGPHFDAPRLIDDAVAREIRDLARLAPLHNPANATGIDVARRLLADVPHVAVFDTAFFHGLPEVARTYAIDSHTAAASEIRRYGFHGTSHEYVSAEVARLLARPLGELNQIVLHLGNGASASAIRGGRAVETSMGMTPLEGLVMGTRSGDLDAGVVLALLRAGRSVDEVDDLLNHRSGLKGLSGENDMRALVSRRADGDPAATLAFDVYVHRLRKYIGAYAAVLGRIDALCFTAGVGEHSAAVRAAALDGLAAFGLMLDAGRNEADRVDARVISPDGAAVSVVVIPTNEEYAIARKVMVTAGLR